MSSVEKQSQIVARYRLIEDMHERLAAITAAGAAWPGISAEERIDSHLVPGCTSRVWLVGELQERRCRFRVDAESALVRGLAVLLCESYDGATPADVVMIEPDLTSALGLDRILSPTRLHGFASIRVAIREFARRCG